MQRMTEAGPADITDYHSLARCVMHNKHDCGNCDVSRLCLATLTLLLLVLPAMHEADALLLLYSVEHLETQHADIIELAVLPVVH